MPLDDIGPVGYHQGTAVATLSYSPLNDRSGFISRLLIDKVSAADTWVLTCGGRELSRFDIQTIGNQQLFSGPYSAYPKNNDLFRLWNSLNMERLMYPVPMGQTFTVASVGGATANISISFVEVRNEEITTGQMNHPRGTRMVTILAGYRAANVTAVGENTLDTQIGPTWFPNIFVDGIIPNGWRFRILGMFLEGGGRNTYSGSADHLSTTTYLAIYKNGQRMFTRDNAGGIPLIGQAAAAGSANTVVSTDETPFPPFQEAEIDDWALFREPFVLGEGDQYQFRLNVAGDVTGGATYAAMRQLFLCDVQSPGV